QQDLLAEAAHQQNLIQNIRAQSVPWTNILHYLSQAVPRSIGLTSLTTQGSALTLTGETLDPNQVPAFWNTINTASLFSGANVTSITRQESKVAFQMNVILPQPADAAIGKQGI